MTYDPEANEAMQKPNTLGASASDTSDQEGPPKPGASKKSGNKPNNVRKIRRVGSSREPIGVDD
jgi:hypothetical protein